MILLKNRKELEREKNKINQALISQIENDLKIIEEEMTHYDDEFISKYGPIVVLLNQDERQTLLEKMPVLKELECEYRDVVFDSPQMSVVKELYLLTDSGIITYEQSIK